MNLCDRCVHNFDSRDWRHGAEYFRRGAVFIAECGPTAMEAEVEGSTSSPYFVHLDWSEAQENTLLVWCSCPRFLDMGLCKHVAATIMAAEDDGISPLLPGKGPLYIEPVEGPDAVIDKDGEVWELDDTDRDDRASDPLPRFGHASTMVFGATRQGRGASRPVEPEWKTRLASLAQQQANELSKVSDTSGRPWSKPRQIWYLLDVARTLKRGWPCVSLRQRAIKKNGQPGKLKLASLSQEEVGGLTSQEDRNLIGLLAGNERDPGYGYSYNGYSSYFKLGDFAIAPALFDVALPRLCASGRFGWLPADGIQGEQAFHLLAWDDGAAWRLCLDFTKSADQKAWQLQGKLQRGSALEELSAPLLLLAAGLVVFPDRVARFDSGDAFQWVAMLRQSGPLLVPVKREQDFVEQLVQMPSVPTIEWPEEVGWQEERPAPHPRLTISKSTKSWSDELECRLTFEYGDRSAPFGDGPPAWYDRKTRRAVRRNLAAERDERNRLVAAGAHRNGDHGRADPALHFMAPAKLPDLVAQLTAAGWQVEAEGHLIRSAGKLSLSVTSGVDWFDLEGACDFGDTQASLPQLLAALRSGQQFVQLDDGSHGMLPEEWLARYGHLAEMGEATEGRLRFLPTQALLLDALLAAQETQRVTVDEGFARLRDRLRSFDGIKPCNEPRSFVGELRQYQREGLGWLHFLDEFGFGGCLADDMGLGKTIQVLALLVERHRQCATANGSAPQPNAERPSVPSLAVVPRSLVFNWVEEAKRFAPSLRVLNYTGLDRRSALEQFNDHDLVVTTYGTLRRDAAKLSGFEFDYAILDEAQAIKNASSQSAKACRLLRARRRLVMTGTPVENHLGDLWSLFEFLNPGMLGRNRKLQEIFSGGRATLRSTSDQGNGRQPTEDLALLSRALRPFMLRRTKQQVLSELPAKTEQTLYCELDGAERAAYDELREHYRRSLLERINKVGVNKSKIHVLEALLRLRQAACHPGLLDKKKIDAGSAKLDTLLEQLGEVIEEGHKALVFSQFTSLLAIVRRQLDRREIVYEYLDGKTTRRQAKVERFQTDPACRLFLISLKAGGQGLNLTAADYVFILDPWWNPAVEAQAVDRAHRIGQDRNVFAYRLVAQDTVEEKILQLQQRKRDLADAIISADKSLLQNLTADDLQILLG
jgi:superfamily II DNA or RNA helicase